MLLLSRHMRVPRWRRQLGDAEPEQGRKIPAAA